LIPTLDRPGAGVPAWERFLYKNIIKPVVAERLPWGKNAIDFKKISRLLVQEWECIPADQRSKKILVPKQMGLEDSSRYWSASMVLEHIVIVGQALIKITEALAAGEAPQGRADTAAVKPLGVKSPEEVWIEFKTFSEVDFPSLLARLKMKESTLTFEHPWFGPMTARGWYWLLATHHNIHLKQLRSIRKEVVKIV
jgi:hypothetical protein